MRQAGFILLAFFALQLLAACTTPVPPTVTQGPLASISEKPTIFLMARRQHERVQQSLSDAGLTPVLSLSEANYQLVVNIGRSRGAADCGPTANVIYTLSRQYTQILEMKGRGKTGSCSPNILDDMSAKLATFYQ